MRWQLVMIAAVTLGAGAAAAAPAAPARQPSTAPALAAAEAAWQAAERATGPGAVEAWVAAAAAFADVATSPSVTAAERAEATWAEVLAWAEVRRRRIGTRARPAGADHARDLMELAALERAVASLPLAGPARAEVLYRRAEARARTGDDDGARADLADVVDHHRDADVAPFAALRLLDALAAAGQHEALAQRVVALRADAGFRARAPDVAETLDALAFVVARREAEALTAAGDPACHDRYLAAVAIDPGRPDVIDARINAGLCLAATGDVDAALADLDAGRAPRRAAVALAWHTGRFAEAAALAARDVDVDADRLVAVELAATVGRLDLADRLAARFRTRAVAGAAPALVALAGAHLALGQRAAGRAWLAAAEPTLAADHVPQVGPRIRVEADTRDRFAQLAWQASCDADVGDGVCPRRRRSPIAGTSLTALVESAPPATAARRRLDLRLEGAPPAAHTTDGLAAAYRALLPQAGPAEALVVRARLALVAARAGDVAAASAEHAACAALATTQPSQLALCDASVDGLGLVPPASAERRPPPARAPLPWVDAR
ncbi:MAG: hypothetical protein R3B06_23010 [Kofleriaceae bacterium]